MGGGVCSKKQSGGPDVENRRKLLQEPRPGGWCSQGGGCENGTKGKRSKGNKMRAAINQLINAGWCTQPVFISFNHSPSQYNKNDDTLQMITYVLV